MVPSTMALKLPTQPSFSIHDWACGMVTRALRSRYGAQDPPVMVTASRPRGWCAPACGRIGPMGEWVRAGEAVTVVLSFHGADGESVAQQRSEEHTSELQSRFDLVCRLLLEKKKKNKKTSRHYLA